MIPDFGPEELIKGLIFLRKAKGYTAKDWAKHIGWSVTKVYRLEKLNPLDWNLRQLSDYALGHGVAIEPRLRKHAKNIRHNSGTSKKTGPKGKT